VQEYQQWLALKAKIKTLTEELHDVEASIWLKAQALGQINLAGSKTYEDGDFKITITNAETYKVDQKIAAERPELFRAKYEFNKSEYKNLVKSQKDFVDEAITIVPSKPNFKVVMVEK